MIFLPDTNACIALLRGRSANLTARWRTAKVSDMVLCSVVIYELRHGAERSPVPAAEHARLDLFVRPFYSLPFDDHCARKSAEIRFALERTGKPIGPHDLQIAAIALVHGLTLITHNTREFQRISGLKLTDWELQ